MPRLHTTSGHGIARDICRAEVVGIAAMLAAQRQGTIAGLLSDITLFHAFGQAAVLRDAAGNPSGVLTWAYLSRRTVERMAADPHYRLHASELNEGEVPCFSGIFPRPEALLPQVRVHAAGLGLSVDAYYVTDSFFGQRALFVRGVDRYEPAAEQEGGHA